MDWKEKMICKTNVIRMLQTGICNITFTKSDGTERNMRCTLVEGVAVPYERKTERVKEKHPDIIAVWDVDLASWRSFNYNSLTQIDKYHV